MIELKDVILEIADDLTTGPEVVGYGVSNDWEQKYICGKPLNNMN